MPKSDLVTVTTLEGNMDSAAYLQRIGLTERPDNDLDGLRALHLAHLHRVPFENLDIRWKVPIVLEKEPLFAKIVQRRRGGFCYELNGLFAWLLEDLGFRVERIQGQVFNERKRQFGQPFDHMALLVYVDDRPYLTDVGFGELFMAPMLMEIGHIHREDGRSYLLAEDEEGWIELCRTNGSGAFTPVYRFSTEVHPFEAFGPMCTYHQTSPQSHFTQRTICTLPLPGGRVTLTDRRSILTREGLREERSFTGDEFHELMRTHFGMDELPVEAVWPVPKQGHGRQG